MSSRRGPRPERRILTPEQDVWFEQNVAGKSCREMAELVTKTFDMPMTKDQVKTYMARHHLHNGLKWQSRPRPERRLLTPAQDEWFKSNIIGRSCKEMAELVTKTLGVPFTENQVKSYMNRFHLQNGRNMCFKTGVSLYPPPKGVHYSKATEFKPGQMPVNYKPVGSERIDVDGYVYIKTADPRTWRPKHVVVWEKENGPVPKGYALLFADGNKLNISLENLLLVSRAQLLILNHMGLLQKDRTLNETAILTADLILKIADVTRRSKKKEARG